MKATAKDALAAFDSFGDQMVHNQALQSRLKQNGYEIESIVIAIEKAIDDGLLKINSIGEISRTN